jgi:NADH:ubiquinone oxidoreductase subunit F (NADH-binding)
VNPLPAETQLSWPERGAHVETVTEPMRLLNATARTLVGHLTRVGPLPDVDPGRLRASVTQSGLVGRGGAGFPTGRKLVTVAAGGRSVVVANGAEGEPASAKDRFLLANAPHLVLDGIQVAARAAGSRRAFIYAPQDLLDDVIAPALRERRDRVQVRMVASPDAFLSGEESAVVSAVQGGPAIPVTTPPRVFERGVKGRPTLVQNVETLCHLALIARFGAEWFRSVGSPEEPGTRLVTLSGAVNRPGVYEAEGGQTLEHVLSLGGGVRGPVQAVLVGGYHGGWVPFERGDSTLRMTRRSLAPFEAAPGAGVVMALPRSVCGLQAGADIAGYLAGQGAGQCGPCLNGLPTLASTLRELAYGRPTPGLVAEVDRVAALVASRGACHHPDGTVRIVRSTLRTFGYEVSRHLQGHCSASEVTVERGPA